MFQALYEYAPVSSLEALMYRPRAYGEVDADGHWNGWLVFFPLSSQRRVIATARETTQESFGALLDWATGLTPVYLERALERALDLQENVALESEVAKLEHLQRDTKVVADDLEQAAASAHRIAGVAADRRSFALQRSAPPRNPKSSTRNR